MQNNPSDIVIIGAKENNLKNLDVRIPINSITCVIGQSGSGKTSLVDKVIAAEAYRLKKITDREASEYDLFVRPDFKSIYNLPNCISINQESIFRTENSNVATYSGINNYLRKLLLEHGEILCTCGNKVYNLVRAEHLIYILKEKLSDDIYEFYFLISKNKIVEIEKIKKLARDYNFDHFKVEGNSKIFNLKEVLRLNSNKKFTIRAYIGKFRKEDISYTRLDSYPINNLEVYHNDNIIIRFYVQTFCHVCFTEYQVKSNSLFTRSKLSELSGCCIDCNGTGQEKIIAFEKLINKNNKTLDLNFLNIENNGKAYKYINIQNSHIKRFLLEKNIDGDCPYELLPSSLRGLILDFLQERLHAYMDSPNIQNFIHINKCNSCEGSGFNSKARSVYYKNNNISDFLQLTISQALDFFHEDFFADLTLRALSKLSLDHLKLNRETTTLSGGELQRLKLVDILSKGVDSSLFIIDEPSIGLHIKDLQNLLKVFYDLVSEKNTLLIVDHNPFVIQYVDKTINLGPGSGANGGYILEENAFDSDYSYYRKKTNISSFVNFKNVNYHNINNQEFSLAINKCNCLIGVSGSGKSSLATYIEKNKNVSFDEIILLSQFSIGKNGRSTISTYIGISEDIRKLYSLTNRAQYLDLSKSEFTPNSEKGACDVCKGRGIIGIDICYACDGKKLNPFILSIELGGFNIHELENTPINELLDKIPSLCKSKKISTAIEVLNSLGLSHLTLGQGISNISGGESQRIKLAKYLLQNNNLIIDKCQHNLLILDEPSQGLNKKDTYKILDVIDFLLSKNNTVLIIEHNEFLIKSSDYLIELGPGAGQKGGVVTFCGKSDDYSPGNIAKLVFEKPEKPTENYLYSSAIINNEIDNSHFLLIDYLYANWLFKGSTFLLEELVRYFQNRDELYSYYMKKKSSNDVFFNPFSFQFIKSSLISKNQVEQILSLLNKYLFSEIELYGETYSCDKALDIINNNNCWDVTVKASSFEQAYEFGNGWVIVKDGGCTSNFTTSLLSVKDKIFTGRKVDKKSFNIFYNKCNICNGSGVVEYTNFFVADINKSVLDILFYPDEFSKIMNDKLSKKLKVIFDTFESQKLFSFKKPYKTLCEKDLLILHHGLPNHKFLKNNGRSSAIGDYVKWNGLTSFFIENIKIFSISDKEKFLDQIKSINCPDCAGKKHNHAMELCLRNMDLLND